MIDDIVVDTNVLAHAGNPDEARQQSSIDLVVALKAGKTSICVDAGFHLDESKNRSHIAVEYRSLCRHLSAINVHRRLMRGS